MGTRSLTFVTEDAREPIMCMYRQMDGYPSGHGNELYEFLKTKKIVNGLGGDYADVANGAGCLAAQLVAHFKDGPGGIYLYRPLKNMSAWQEYEYWIDVNDKGITVKVFSPKFGKGNLLFEGDIQEFGNWIKQESKEP